MISILQKLDDIYVYRVFYKKMEPGDRRCCNYKEKDCSHDQKNDSTVIFAVSLIKNDLHFSIDYLMQSIG